MKTRNDTPVKRKGSKATARAPAKVVIRRLPTGVRGLDEILGGGIPEFSFNIIAG
ncbi:MAG: ATPase domain-containing protein, partial [Limisphaerales bacterium]